MLTRGILRSVIPPALTNAVVMRASGGPSILKELSNEQIACSMEDAVRMNVRRSRCRSSSAANLKPSRWPT